MAIFITGDTHGDFSRLQPAAFHEQRDLTEMVKIVLRAKHGVNGTVIGSVVAVVGGRFKNGVQIQHCDAEIRQIVQFGEDTLQRTAEKVAVPHFTLCVRPPVREI